MMKLPTVVLILCAGISRGDAGDIENTLKSLPRQISNGYASSVGGGTISYHSVNSHARSALIVRATDGTQYIEWETSPVPAQSPPEGRLAFAWLAALSGSKGVHRFDVEVNGTTMFRFNSLPDSSQKTFSAEGAGGSTLVFCATEADRFGDLFGYMFLSLPADSLPPGTPLRIRVKGEAAGSSAWFMVFEHRLEEKAWVTPLPALLRTSGGGAQPVEVEIEHYGAPGIADINLEGAERTPGWLRWGVSSFSVRTRPVSSAVKRRIRVRTNAGFLTDSLISMLPVTRRTLYLLPHSHTDIGYSAYQAVVEKNHMRYIDSAIAIAERSAAYPSGARFRWNIEVMWPLESYVSAASPKQLARLARAVDNGWIGLNGLYANVLTGLCRQEEFYHLTDYARKAASRFRHPVRSAMISDIPSYSASIVTGLAKAGVRYFSSGPNYVPSFSDGGDRIGFALKAWGDKPFYWVSASKEDTVLFWMAGRGYSWFHGLNMGELGAANGSEIFDYVRELDAREYPYDMVQVRYTVGGDNGPPDPNLPDVVRSWNETYLSPQFAIATAEEMFEEFERKYGKSLPVRTGDLTPYWEDGAASTARELAENRRAAEELTQTETLYALLNPAAYDPGRVYSAWRGVHLFDEHTWGAANSITDPDSPDVKAQWEYKLSFLRSAQKGEEVLRRGVVKPFPKGPVRSIEIFNTCSWPRTDLVLLPENIHVAGLRAHDAAGKPVPAQRVASGETALLVTDVPPFGCTRVSFEPGDPFTPSTGATARGTTLQNGIVEVSVDPGTGAISRLVPGGGENLVDTSGHRGLNEYLYVAGRDPRNVSPDSRVSVRVTDSGPLVAALRITSTPPGGTRLERTVRVTGGMGRVDVADSLWKTSVREKEGVHIGFALLPGGGVTRIDNGFSVIRPDSDQLPGSCRDFFCAGRWVDVSDGHRGVVLAVPDAPLVETGAMTDERLNRGGTRTWRELAGGGTSIYSYIMNNYWHTNYKADQEGEAAFRYALMPHGPFDPAAAERFGIGITQPLIPVPADSARKPGISLLTIEPSSVIATALKPAAQGKGWVLHLYNAGGEATGVSVAWHGPRPAAFYGSDLTEQRGEKVTFPVLLPPSGAAIVRIE